MLKEVALVAWIICIHLILFLLLFVCLVEEDCGPALGVSCIGPMERQMANYTKVDMRIWHAKIVVSSTS